MSGFSAFSKVLFFSGALTLSTAPAQRAEAQYAAAAPVNSIIDNLKQSIEEVLDRVDQSVSSGTFLTRMQLSNLLSEVSYQADQVEGKTFADLDAEQQRFFNNTQQTIKDIQDMGDHVSDNADKVADKLAFVIGSVPFTSKEPRLNIEGPRVVNDTDIGQPLRLTFEGLWLANGKPTLGFGKASCTLSDLVDTKAVFTCPPEAFAGVGSGPVRYASGQFAAVPEQGFWDGVWAFFGSKPKYKSYPVSVGIISNKFAHAKVTTVALVDSDVPSDRTQAYDTGARHCTWGSDTTVNITPQGPQWLIDVKSIVIHVASANGSPSTALRNPTPKGFQVYAVGHNSGSCFKEPITGTTIANDGRGWNNGTITWTEHMTKTQPAPGEALDGELNWGDTKVVPLPDRIQSYVVTLLLFNGSSRDYNAPGDDEFFDLTRDDTNHSLKLQPKQIAAAFK